MFCEWYHQYSIQMYTGRSIFFIKSQTFKWNRSSEHGGALNGPRAQFEPRKSSARCLWICVRRKCWEEAGVPGYRSQSSPG